MALIIDPDNLNDGSVDNGSTEVFIDTSAKTVKLNQTGNLSTDGVTLKCLYSFLKEEWKNDPQTKNLAAFPFPMVPITDESFEFVDGWDFVADASRYLIRTGGWTVRNTSGNVIAKWAGVVSLGNIDSGGQVYMNQGQGRVNFQLTGAVNQAVQIISDPNGDGAYGDGFDRTSQLDLYVREYSKTYAKTTMSDIGVSALDSIVYRFPLANGTDLNIIENDTNVGANSPYTQIGLKYFGTAFSRDVDSATDRNFGVVVDVGTWSGVDGSMTSAGSALTSAEGGIPSTTYDGGTLVVHEGTNAGSYTITTATGTTVNISGTFSASESGSSFTLQRATPVTASLQQIYTKVQYLLRQASDIDDTSGSAITGDIADSLLTFVGSALTVGNLIHTNPEAGGSGVIIEGFSASDTNSLTFYDNSDTTRQFPFVASLTLNFGANLQNDASSEYWVYFTTLPGAGDDFGESGAVIVDKFDTTDMTGPANTSSVVLSFDYDNNVQGGRTAATDAGVTAVAIGLSTGQYVRATGTIERSTTNSISLVAPLERNYANP